MVVQTEYLGYLLMVAECGSLNKAAQELYISQPALNSAMNSLEKELGYSILNRSSKGVTLTKVGEQIVKDANGIIATIKRWQSLAEIDDEICKNVAVCGFGTINAYLFPELVLRMKNKYKTIKITTFNQTDPIETIKMVNKDKVRVGIIGVTEYRKKELFEKWRGSVQFEKLLKENYHVVFNGLHSLTNNLSNITLESIKDFPIVMYSTEDLFEIQYIKQLKKFFLESKWTYLATNEAILSLLGSSDAITFFPEMYIYYNSAFSSGELAHSNVKDLDLTLEHYLVYSKEEYLTKIDKIIVEEIRQIYLQYKKSLVKA